MEEYPYRVQNFSYNGLMGTLKKGMTSYQVEFKKWTNDPGVGIFECSDSKERLIPTFALKGLKERPLPEQDMSKKIIFGKAAHS